MSITPRTAPAARRLAATAAMTLVTASLAGSIGIAGPAQAAPETGEPVRPADCRPGRHGFVATPPHVPRASSKERVRLSSRTVLELRQGRLHGHPSYWARILGNLQPGDRYWLDWSRDGGRTFLRCGPFRVSHRRVAAWTPAHSANPARGWVFRGGAQLAMPGAPVMTTPWRS